MALDLPNQPPQLFKIAMHVLSTNGARQDAGKVSCNNIVLCVSRKLETVWCWPIIEGSDGLQVKDSYKKINIWYASQYCAPRRELAPSADAAPSIDLQGDRQVLHLEFATLANRAKI